MPSGRAFIGARLRRSLLVGVGVAAVSLALAPGALASTTIGNNPPWTMASGIISGFGYGQPCCTATYGQTVTVPATDTTLGSFTFYVQLPTNLIFRGEVYAWDPSTGNPANFTSGNATGPALYESGPMHTASYNSGFGPYEPITFNTGGIPVTAGAQYVLFFTISRDYAANAPTAGIPGFAGITATDTYPGGDFVFLNNGGDTSQWTTTPWSNLVGLGADDLAFTASFSPLPSCTPSTSANFRWHYSASGSSGSWSGTQSAACGGSLATKSQAMEGDLKLAPGNTIQGGYDFTVPGNHQSLFWTVNNPQIVFTLQCVSGPNPSPPDNTLTLTMPNATYNVTSDQWYPSGDQHSSLVYQGSVKVPDVCNGALVRFNQGGVFSASLS